MSLLICFKTFVNFHLFNIDYIELISTYENSLNNVTLHPQMENVHATCQCTDLTWIQTDKIDFINWVLYKTIKTSFIQAIIKHNSSYSLTVLNVLSEYILGSLSILKIFMMVIFILQFGVRT